MKSQLFKNAILIIIFCSAFTKLYSQCTDLYGVLGVGGENNNGAIFKTDGNGENLQIIYSPVNSTTGSNPLGDLFKAGNGKYYGLTSQGGKYNLGTIFEYEPQTGLYTTKFNFTQDSGMIPRGNLIQGDNGKLYGLTWRGGSNDLGVLFEWDPLTGIFSKKSDFDGTANGSNPEGSLVLSSNGKLYGMTYSGGTYDKGVLFEWDPENDTLIKKFDFNGEVNGSFPHGSLIQAKNLKLYGMTSSGSANDDGVIFEFDPFTDTYIKKIDFGVSGSGKKPYGTLFQSSDGRFYGMTYTGGANGAGVIFEWDFNLNKLITKVELDGLNGKDPRGSLIQAENGKMYGMTSGGGTAGKGVLFEWDPSANIYLKKHDFVMTNKGATVYGSLCPGAGGKLYGMTSSTGVSNKGAIFEWDPATDSFKDLISMQSSENGSYFTGSLVQAPNGKLYGMTATGGVNNLGILYEWDPGENKFTRKIDFNGAELGASPWGCGLTVKDNYSLYGVTGGGGTNNLGVLFEWNYHTNTLTKKMDFNGREKGSFPRTTLLKAGNGKLYGLTRQGGEHGWGVLFEWDPATDTYAKKFDFNDPLGSQPCQSLIQASNGKLYGMTSTGGIYGYGTIFEYDIAENTYTKKIDFNMHETGSTPEGSLFQADNGMIYGMTFSGGSYGEGVLFEWDPETNAFSKIMDFDGPLNGAQPDGSLMQAANGKLYGVAEGGQNSGGVLFQWDPGTKIFTKKLDFDPKNGYRPYFGSLIEINKHSKSIRTASCENYLSPSGKYIWTTTGIYTDTIAGAIDCDSIITVDLTINHSSTGTIYPFACESYKSPSERFTWTESGIYLDTIPNASGCDSVISIYLTVLRPSSSISGEVACETFDFNGRILTSSGTYYDTIPNAMGCDSVMTLNLTILRSSASTLNESACGYYRFNGRIVTSSGTYIDTIANTAGCDSVITLNLHIDRVDTTVFQDRYVLVSLDMMADHQWIDCDNSNLPIDGENHGTFTAHKNGRYAVIVSNGVCVDTSAVFEVLGTGIADPNSSHISLYPNPTSGSFTIDLGKVYPEAIVTITRYDGQVIRKEKLMNSHEIDLNLKDPPGIYMITVSAENEKIIFKVVKK
jgi:uncharacterized repeat protein (TIGR03803 family)